MPHGLRKIGDEAFSDCKSLRLVVLNEGLVWLQKSEGDPDQGFCGSDDDCG